MKKKRSSKILALVLLLITAISHAEELTPQGYAVDEVAGPVVIAASAATVNINMQMEDYAYIPFH
jgi:hypothetical protein